MGRHRRAAICSAVTIVVALAATTARTQSVIGSLPYDVVAPEDNPTTPEKVELGRLLFWDPILSGAKDVACASCHHPDFGYSDSLDLSMGTHGMGLGATRRFDAPGKRPFVKRNSPTILNIGFAGIDMTFGYEPSQAPLFWDMRVRSLEAQALEPLKSLEEMRGEAFAEPEAVEMIVARLHAIPEYRTRFARAFNTSSAVSTTYLAKAIAAFERSIVALNSPFDRYVRGETSAMTPLQLSGMQRFQSTGCANCHKGPMFTDYQVHTLGVPDNPGLPESDSGVDGKYRFRTASLRNLLYTAPYMHSGMLATLDDVLSFYNGVRGFRTGTRNANVAPGDLDPLVFSLVLGGGDRRDIVAFLEALSDEDFDRAIPDKVPSGLPVGGRIRD